MTDDRRACEPWFCQREWFWGSSTREHSGKARSLSALSHRGPVTLLSHTSRAARGRSVTVWNRPANLCWCLIKGSARLCTIQEAPETTESRNYGPRLWFPLSDEQTFLLAAWAADANEPRLQLAGFLFDPVWFLFHRSRLKFFTLCNIGFNDQHTARSGSFLSHNPEE